MKKVKKVFFTILNVILLLPTRVFAAMEISGPMYGVSPEKRDFPSLIEIFYQVFLCLLVPYIIFKGIWLHIKKIEKEEKIFYKVLTVLETLVCCALGLFMIGTIFYGIAAIMFSVDLNGDLMLTGSSFIDAMIECITIVGPLLIILTIVICTVNMLWKRSFSTLIKLAGVMVLTDIIYALSGFYVLDMEYDFLLNTALIFGAIFIVANVIRILRKYWRKMDEKQNKQNDKMIMLNFIALLFTSVEIWIALNNNFDDVQRKIKFMNCASIALCMCILGEDIYRFIYDSNKKNKNILLLIENILLFILLVLYRIESTSGIVKYNILCVVAIVLIIISIIFTLIYYSKKKIKKVNE